MQMLKTGGTMHPDERHDDLKQVEVYKSHSKFMKSKVGTPDTPTLPQPRGRPWAAGRRTALRDAEDSARCCLCMVSVLGDVVFTWLQTTKSPPTQTNRLHDILCVCGMHSSSLISPKDGFAHLIPASFHRG